MVVNDFNVERVPLAPAKTESPLLVHAHAVLSLAIAFERLELISGRHAQVTDIRRCIQVLKLLSRTLLNLAIKPFDKLTAEDGFRSLVLERTNHLTIVTRVVPSV